VFAVVIFIGGRMSAPVATPERVTTVIREIAPAAPSIVIVPSARPEPTIPLAVLPEAAPEPVKSVSTPVQRPVTTPKVVQTTPKAIPSVPVVLEETPEDIKNPYKR
jgi:hypothetical protein